MVAHYLLLVIMHYLWKLCHNHCNWNCLVANVLQNYWKELVVAMNLLASKYNGSKWQVWTFRVYSERKVSIIFVEWHRSLRCSVSSLWREGGRMHRPTFLLSQAWKTSETGIISCIKLPSESAQPQRTSFCTASFPQAFLLSPLKLILLNLFFAPATDE